MCRASSCRRRSAGATVHRARPSTIPASAHRARTTRAVRTVTLNRPDKANALTPGMIAQLIAAVRAAVDGGARAIVLTGRGRVFSAGADLEAARAGLALAAPDQGRHRHLVRRQGDKG